MSVRMRETTSSTSSSMRRAGANSANIWIEPAFRFWVSSCKPAATLLCGSFLTPPLMEHFLACSCSQPSTSGIYSMLKSARHDSQTSHALLYFQTFLTSIHRVPPNRDRRCLDFVRDFMCPSHDLFGVCILRHAHLTWKSTFTFRYAAGLESSTTSSPTEATSSTSSARRASPASTAASITLFPSFVLRLRLIVDQQGVER